MCPYLPTCVWQSESPLVHYHSSCVPYFTSFLVAQSINDPEFIAQGVITVRIMNMDIAQGICSL